MAALETTVSSPHGGIITLPGRVPRGEAIDIARREVQRVIMAAQDHEREFENWDVKTHRGTTPALSHEDLEARRG